MRMTRFYRSVHAATLLLSVPALAVAEYEEYTVQDAGEIRGHVRVVGEIPKVAALAVEKDANVCGHNI